MKPSGNNCSRLDPTVDLCLVAGSDVKTKFFHNRLSICLNRFFTDNQIVIETTDECHTGLAYAKFHVAVT